MRPLPAALALAVLAGAGCGTAPVVVGQAKKTLKPKSAPVWLKPTKGTASKNKIVLAFGGDVIFDRGIRTRLDRHGAAWPFRKLRPFWEDADLAVVNLESPVGFGGEELGEKSIRFRADPSSLDALALGGVGLVSLSNNHILDYGPDLARQTLSALGERGIRHTGLAYAGKRTEPAWVELKGKKLAFFSFCNVCPGEFDPVGKAVGAAVAHPGIMYPDLRRVRAKADYVIVLMHWGMEYQPHTPLQRKLAAGLVEAGADLVIGCHPHVLQATERMGKSFVAYSLGNLVFDMYHKQALDAAVLKVTLSSGKAPQVEALPLSVKSFRPVPVAEKGKTFMRIRKALSL